MPHLLNLTHLLNLKFFYPLLMLHMDEITKWNLTHVDWLLLLLFVLHSLLFALFTLSTSSLWQFHLFFTLALSLSSSLVLQCSISFYITNWNEGEKKKLIETPNEDSLELVREEEEKKRRKERKGRRKS